jgi:hypothetical protein
MKSGRRSGWRGDVGEIWLRFENDHEGVPCQ